VPGAPAISLANNLADFDDMPELGICYYRQARPTPACPSKVLGLLRFVLGDLAAYALILVPFA
jgi:hypothetical protein